MAIFVSLVQYIKYKEQLQNTYVPLKPYHTPGYTCVSGGHPVNPLKPCAVLGQDLLRGGVPLHPLEEYVNQKGAAASPPLPLGVSILSGGALGHPLKVGPVPGQHKVSGGPLGVPLKRKYILEYGKASGVRILQLFFIFSILNEEEQNT